MGWRDLESLGKYCLWVGEAALACVWPTWTAMHLFADCLREGYLLAAVAYGGIGTALGVYLVAQAWESCRMGLRIRRGQLLQPVFDWARTSVRRLPLVLLTMLAQLLAWLVFGVPDVYPNPYASIDLPTDVLLPLGLATVGLYVVALPLASGE